MRALLATVLVAFATASCQSAGDGLPMVSEPAVLSSAAASAIAGDIASRFAEHVPPSSTTLQIRPDQSDFGVALTAALKGWGYGFVTAPDMSDAKAMKLDYALMGIDGQIFVQLITPSIAVSRAYHASLTDASPVSPLSIMQRN